MLKMERERSRGRIAGERIAATLRRWINVAFRVFYYGYRRDLNFFFHDSQLSLFATTSIFVFSVLEKRCVNFA